MTARKTNRLQEVVNSDKSLSGGELGDLVSAASRTERNGSSNLSVVQVVVVIQFGIAVALAIFAVVGLSINQPVGFLPLMALLQCLIAFPGFAYHFTKKLREN
uniref:SoxR reducing system RseC family protein n=1 Tax=Angiostrongylus cantonensis TaxID=6313 RepID=A0A0K0DIZ4_ANGCA